MGFGTNLKNALGIGSGPKGQFTDARQLIDQQDKLNRYNINSAVGSRTFTKDPTGRTILNIEETPYQKAFRQLQEQQALDVMGSKAPSAEDFYQQGRDISNALYETSMYQLRPEFQSQDRQLTDYLSNRGIPLGSEAYTRALRSLRRDRGEQLNQLGLQSTLAASQEQDRLVRLAEAQRAARLAESGSATQGIDMGFFGDVVGIDAAGITSGQEAAINTYNLNRFQDQQRRQSATLNESIKAGGTAATKSDMNLKENIRKVGKEKGFNIYEFNYKGNSKKYKGVMAQEVHKIMPEAVTIQDGFLAVFYDKIGIKFKEI